MMTEKKKNNRRTYLPHSKPCFVCGEDNEAGLHTRFYLEDGVVKASLNAQAKHCGYPGVVHGGVVAAILDETMGWAATRVLNRMTVTADLKVRYVKPVPPEREMTVVTEVTNSNRRMAKVRGEIQDETGEVYARSEARFFPLSVEQSLEVDDFLLYEDGQPSIFASLRDEES